MVDNQVKEKFSKKSIIWVTLVILLLIASVFIFISEDEKDTILINVSDINISDNVTYQGPILNNTNETEFRESGETIELNSSI